MEKAEDKKIVNWFATGSRGWWSQGEAAGQVGNDAIIARIKEGHRISRRKWRW